jgi:uncharacterized phage protein (TIGR02218 family)
MKTVSTALATLLATTNQYQMADLYTFTLANGTVLRLTDAGADIIFQYIYTYFGSTLRLERGRTKTVIGLEVDELEITLYPAATDLIGATQFLVGLQQGMLDGARLRLERVFMPLYNQNGVPYWGDTTAGSVPLFEGRVGSVTATRTSAVLTVRSDLELLDIQMPRNLYQPGCSRTLFDTGCGLNAANYAVTSSVLAGSTAQQIVTALSQPAGYYAQGYLKMTSGVATGQQASIAGWAGGILTLIMPLSTTPAAGDTFTVWPGCDKTMNTCQFKYNNLTRFRGFPYIPPAETAL